MDSFKRGVDLESTRRCETYLRMMGMWAEAGLEEEEEEDIWPGLIAQYTV